MFYSFYRQVAALSNQGTQQEMLYQTSKYYKFQIYYLLFYTYVLSKFQRKNELLLDTCEINVFWQALHLQEMVFICWFLSTQQSLNSAHTFK